MSLVHAILGFLNRQPLTGYELKTQCFDQSVSYFWPADQAQIYKTLEKMESEQWVESQIKFQNDRPNRRLYCITTGGQNELRRWLETRQPLHVQREPFLVQLYFSEDLKNNTIIELLEHQKILHGKQLHGYESIGMPAFNLHIVPRDVFLANRTLNLGKRMEKAYIEWIEETINMTHQLPDVEE
jgi:PadR family transcriptional regulator, regulatory protein AphA